MGNKFRNQNLVLGYVDQSDGRQIGQLQLNKVQLIDAGFFSGSAIAGSGSSDQVAVFNALGVSGSDDFRYDKTAGALTLSGTFNVTGATSLTGTLGVVGDIVASDMQQYISVRYTVNATNQNGLFTVFDTDFGGTVVTDTSNGITHSTTTGEFTIAKTGKYRVGFTIITFVGTSGTPTVFRLNKNNGTIVWDGSGLNFSATTDPNAYAFSMILPLTAADVIELELNSTGISNLQIKTGTVMDIFRIA